MTHENRVLELLETVVEYQNSQADAINRINTNLGKILEVIDFRLSTMEELAVQNREDATQARANTHDLRNLLAPLVLGFNEVLRSLHNLTEAAKGASSASSDRLQAIQMKVNQSADKL